MDPFTIRFICLFLSKAVSSVNCWNVCWFKLCYLWLLKPQSDTYRCWCATAAHAWRRTLLCFCTALGPEYPTLSSNFQTSNTYLYTRLSLYHCLSHTLFTHAFTHHVVIEVPGSGGASEEEVSNYFSDGSKCRSEGIPAASVQCGLWHSAGGNLFCH